MSINTILKKLILATVLVAVTAMAQTPYDEGQKALREQDWTQAADYFKQSIKDDKNKADASMYWRAHALYKAGRNKEAERQATFQLVGILAQYYQRSIELVTIAANPATPPAVADVAKQIAESAGEVIERTLRTFDQVRDPSLFLIEVEEAIDEAIRGRTTIVIAHRLSTIKNADKIVVIENGKLVEEGTLAELLYKKDKFYGYWEEQKFF